MNVGKSQVSWLNTQVSQLNIRSNMDSVMSQNAASLRLFSAHKGTRIPGLGMVGNCPAMAMLGLVPYHPVIGRPCLQRLWMVILVRTLNSSKTTNVLCISDGYCIYLGGEPKAVVGLAHGTRVHGFIWSLSCKGAIVLRKSEKMLSFLIWWTFHVFNASL